MVTSEKDFKVSNAVFFPLLGKADMVSYPVKAWKTGSVRHGVGVIVETILEWLHSKAGLGTKGNLQLIRSYLYLAENKSYI